MKQAQPTYYTVPKIGELQLELIDKLAYFGVFHHPLRADELQNLLQNHFPMDRVFTELDRLVSQGICYRAGNYYGMHAGVEEEIENRLKNEHHAQHYFRRLPAYARLICQFPYVRGVAVSGSLSKGVIHADGDIDYFVITAHNRLWMTRMLLIIFKKIALFNSRKYFCVNYFVSEKHLEIPDQNLFTATEIVTLLPVFNAAEVNRFKAANPWSHLHYGHFNQPLKTTEQQERFKGLKHAFEWLLNNKLGDWLDVLSMYITVWRWQVKFKTFNQHKFELTLRSTRNVSKHHPRDFQTNVLQQTEENKQTIYGRFTADT